MMSLTKFRKTTALLLLALMAMLPLQGLQAAFGTLGHHNGDAHSPAQHIEHVMIDSAGVHACQMHDHDSQAQNEQHCSSTGCDMCGTCHTDLPRPLLLSLSHEHLLPTPAHQPTSIANAYTPLYRPPRA